MRRVYHRILCGGLLLIGLLVAETGFAGELYVSGLVGIYGGSGSVSVSNTLANFSLSG